MNLTSLILSKALVNSGLIVHLFSSNKNYMGPSTRTIGVSKSNVNFINKNIIDLKTKKLHDIKKISILSEKKNEIIKFYNKGENLFSLIEVTTLFNILYNKGKPSIAPDAITPPIAPPKTLNKGLIADPNIQCAISDPHKTI